VSCPGLHCPGCSGGESIGILAAVVVGLVVADRTVQWVAERIVWIGGTIAVSLAVAVVASMALGAWTERREARFAARRGIYSRADHIAPEPARCQIRHGVSDIGTAGAEIGNGITDLRALPAPGVTINIFGQPSPEQAAVIRQAIERK